METTGGLLVRLRDHPRLRGMLYILSGIAIYILYHPEGSLHFALTFIKKCLFKSPKFFNNS